MCLSSPKPQPVIPPPTDVDTNTAARRERERRARQQGYASTILTGGQGDLSSPTLAKTSVLGGSV